MPNKSHIIHQPKVAVFDLINLAYREGSEAPGNALHSPQPGRHKKIRRAALPDHLQSGLRVVGNSPLTSGSARIGVLVERLSDDYANRIISGIEAAAEKTGYEIAILNVLGRQQPQPLVGLDNFEGFIACCSDEAAVNTDFLDRLGKPVVVVGNVENVKEYHCVKTDYHAGAQLAVHHLLDRGCQKILMVTSASGNASVSLDKYLGYRDALKKSGRGWQDPLTVMESSIEAGMEMAARMCQQGELPDGIFISNDWVAAGFAKYLKKNAISLDTKTVVVGFGNESLCEMIEPALSSVDFRKEWAGSRALTILVDEIGDPHCVATGRLTLIEPVLVVRD